VYRYYSPEYLQRLKSTANIVDVASQFTSVQKMGRSYLAKCLFHPDEHPSMQLQPDTNTFYCHACGAGSSRHSKVRHCDVIAFVQHAKGVSFTEAVEYLAMLTNTPLPAVSPQEQQKQQQYLQWVTICKQAADTFHEQLKAEKYALSYLYQRGLTDTEIDVWKIGFAGESLPDDWMVLRNRIVFPIYDINEQIVGFAGRVPFPPSIMDKLNEERKEQGKPALAKYVNLKNQQHFVKGHHLYGIHMAKDYIQQWRTAVITEGYTDVISLHRSGVNHAVSTMGTALTEQQARLLKRTGAERVILMRDGDAAGLLAAERDAKVLKQEGLKVFIVPLPDGMDPDDLCYHYGLWNDGVSKYIYQNTQSLEQWKIHRIYKQTQDEILNHYTAIHQRQTERLEKVIEVLDTIEDPIQLDLFIRQISDLFVVSYESIREKLELYQKKKQQDQQKVIPFQRKVI
jgi:DNA primase